MEKKVSEKEKMYRKAIAYVENMMAEGLNVTKARAAASIKFGMGYSTISRLTKHLNVKAID